MYDLDKDPREMNNLYSDASYAGVVKELKHQLRRLQAELDDDVNDVGDKPRTGF